MLKRFRGKTKDIELQGEKFTIHPISFNEFLGATEFYEKKDNIGAMNYILFTSLRKAIPIEDASDAELSDDIKNLDMAVGMQILQEVLDMSGMNPKKESE